MTSLFPIPAEPVVLARAVGSSRFWPLLGTEDGGNGSVFFTTEAKAEAFAKANGLGPEWQARCIPLANLLTALRYNLTHGVPWVVFDPEGHHGAAVPTLAFLAEAESQGE